MSASDTLVSRFLDGMSYAAATVSVVATDGPAGRAGVTVSAMASVTLEGPGPSLLVCVHHKSAACAAILGNGVFTLNVLGESQSRVSDVFAGRIKAATGDKFHAVAWSPAPSGAPRIADALVSFDCRLARSVEMGSHFVLFGTVEDVQVSGRERPLVYVSRAYGAPAPLVPARPHPADGATLTVAAFAPVAPYVVPAVVAALAARTPTVDVRLLEGDDAQVRAALLGGDAEVGILYDFHLDAALAREPLAALGPYVLLPARHPLAARDSVSLADLAAEPLVLLDIPPSRTYALSLFSAAGLTPTPRWYAGSFETVRGLVGHGLGYAILATKPANSVTYDGLALAARPLAEDAAPSRLVAAWRKAEPLGGTAEAFLALCRSRFHEGA